MRIYTTLNIRIETREKLLALRKPGETFADLIDRLASAPNTINIDHRDTNQSDSNYV